MQDINYQEIVQNLLIMKEIWYYTCAKKVSPFYVFEDKKCYKRTPIFFLKKYILMTHSQEELIFGMQPSHVDQKKATM